MITVKTEDLNWATLPVSNRAELLRSGVPFPGETSEERRCRVKAALGLLDDADIQALGDVTADTLAKKRVNGTGPRPVRVLRTVFYTLEDVREWILRHRDAVADKGARK